MVPIDALERGSLVLPATGWCSLGLQISTPRLAQILATAFDISAPIGGFGERVAFVGRSSASSLLGLRRYFGGGSFFILDENLRQFALWEIRLFVVFVYCSRPSAVYAFSVSSRSLCATSGRSETAAWARTRSGRF